LNHAEGQQVHKKAERCGQQERQRVGHDDVQRALVAHAAQLQRHDEEHHPEEARRREIINALHQLQLQIAQQVLHRRQLARLAELCGAQTRRAGRERDTRARVEKQSTHRK
jgi:hypothetical protein